MYISKIYSPGLFSRNFLLLLSLMLCCLAIWFTVFLQSGVAVRASEMSQRVASAVNLTRTALRYAQHQEQSQLLADLSQHESLDVHLRRSDDLLTPLPDERYWRLIEQHLHAWLGPESLIAWEVNQQRAFWVSFTLDQNQYWLAFERQKIREATPIQWVSWIIAAAILSLIGALISTSYLNRPLTRLARFAKNLAQGQIFQPLPEKGAREIQLVNKSFNRMAQALQQIDSDREIMLAGLSHDLRTPLTRMRLEIELSTLPDSTRQRVDTDLEQVDRSINKLIEYARVSSAANQSAAHPVVAAINLSQELTRLITLETVNFQAQCVTLQTKISPNLHARIDPLSLQRILANLFENIQRYGRNPTGIAEIFVQLNREGQELLLEISDSGAGITQQETQTLLRPFSRGNQARTDCIGTGLGLAITERLVRQAHGTMRLFSDKNKGLLVHMRIPAI